MEDKATEGMKGEREVTVYGLRTQRGYILLRVGGKPLEDFQQKCDMI